mgnify:FL=1
MCEYVFKIKTKDKVKLKIIKKIIKKLKKHCKNKSIICYKGEQIKNNDSNVFYLIFYKYQNWLPNFLGKT